MILPGHGEALGEVVQFLLVLAEVHASIELHLIPLLLSDLVQCELLRHVGIEAEVRVMGQQVIQYSVNG